MTKVQTKRNLNYNLSFIYSFFLRFIHNFTKYMYLCTSKSEDEPHS